MLKSLQMKQIDLENYFAFRFIKILFWATLPLGFIVLGFIGYVFIPSTVIDTENSYITCENFNRYSLSSIRVFSFEIVGKELSILGSGDEKARKACAYGIVDDYLGKYTTPQYKNYALTVVEGTSGSWSTPFLIWVAGTGAFIVLLTALKSMLIYLFFGKRTTDQVL